MIARSPAGSENLTGAFAGLRFVNQITMPNAPEFVVGPLIALEGGDGEAVAASGNRIATLGSHQATWWVNETPRTVALPGIRVRGARWATNGNAILAGTGVLDVVHETWSAHPAFAVIAEPGPPGHGGNVIHSTSWSGDQRHAAALLKWSGPSPEADEAAEEQVVVLDLSGDAKPVAIPAAGASGVRIVNDCVVVGTSVIRSWNFAGDKLAELPATRGAPLAMSAGDNEGLLLVLDEDWSIRAIDTATWTERARWRGRFLDAVPVSGGLIAVDHDGTLHAGCFAAGGVREVGTFNTGILAAQLAATGDGRLVIVGAGPVAVHAMSFQLKCH